MLEVSPGDPRDEVRSKSRRSLLVILGLAAALAAVVGYSVTISSTSITPSQVYQSLLNYSYQWVWWNAGLGQADQLFDVPDRTQMIVVHVYAPRVLMAVIVGAMLAIGGCIVQSVMRNPLATPYTLGVSSSAAFGASLAIVLGIGVLSGSPGGAPGTVGTMLTAFAFSLVPAAAILLASMRRAMPPASLVLVGISISYVFSAATTMVNYFGEADAVKSAMFWSVGDLNSASLWQIKYVAVALLALVLVSLLLSKDLDIMRLGDDAAMSLGVAAREVRIAAVLLACLSTAVAVSFTGAIGFICLLAPHISRALVGSGLRALLPASALMGALLLSLADIVAKDLVNPIMLPVGAITALIGGPVLVYLLLRKGKGMPL